MKKLILGLAFLFVLTLFTSCEKRITLNRLEGEWNVTSFIIDGDEGMDYYNSFKMEYEDYKDGEGDVTWTLTDDWGTEILDGTYEINSDADELEILFRDGSDAYILDADIEDIDKEEIELEGFLDGESFRIKAEKD